MYERFTDRARKSMQMANMYASRGMCEDIKLEHVLIAILNAGGVAPNIIRNLGIVPGVIENDIVDGLAEMGYSAGTVNPTRNVAQAALLSNAVASGIINDSGYTSATKVAPQKLNQSKEVKELITLTIEIARNMGSNHVGTEHMLFAIADDKFKYSVAGSVLAKYVTETQIKEQLS